MHPVTISLTGSGAIAHKLQATKTAKIMEEKILMRLDAIERYALLGAKQVLTIGDVALLTGLSKGYLYKLTCARQIPHYKPNGKQMYFDRAEIEDWMRQNRVNTTSEAEQEAARYIVTGKKGGRK